MSEKPPDFLDAAIAAAERKEVVQIEMLTVAMKIMGREDRPAQLVVPKDVTDMEIIALMVAVAQVGDQLRAMRPPPIAIAHAMPQASRP